MKKFFTIISLICLGYLSYGQQQVLFTQYMFNQLPLNAAYTGIHEGVSASMLWREQWVGFEGAPRHSNLFGSFSNCFQGYFPGRCNHAR